MRHIQILPGPVSENIGTSAGSRVLTLADRYGLMAAILDEFINEEEEALNRLLRHVIRGRIQIID